MHKYALKDDTPITRLNVADHKVAELFFLATAVIVLAGSLTVPSMGIGGAMLVGFCCFMPLTQRLWNRHRTSAIGFSVIGSFMLSPAIYGFAHIISHLYDRLV